MKTMVAFAGDFLFEVMQADKALNLRQNCIITPGKTGTSQANKNSPLFNHDLPI
jgi:hypothetical protein